MGLPAVARLLASERRSAAVRRAVFSRPRAYPLLRRQARGTLWDPPASAPAARPAGRAGDARAADRG